MKAYYITKYQKQPATLGQQPTPTIGDNEVLLEVHAAALNHLDERTKNGEFKLLVPNTFPLILGHDVAGVITAVGSKVSSFKVGDAVMARVRDGRIGTFAEYIAVHENDLAPKPMNITMEDAAGIPLVGLTAWQALVQIANVQRNQKVFIHAGAGGVGTIAIQLAKHLGAYVVTTANAQNIDFVKSLGADEVIDYRKDDFSEKVTDCDVVLNSLDEATLLKSAKILKAGGYLISISGPPTKAYAREAKLSWLLQQVMHFISRKVRKVATQKQLHYHFLFMRANGEQLSALSELIERGAIKPVTDKVFPFEHIADAFAYMHSGKSKGKIIVRMK